PDMTVKKAIQCRRISSPIVRPTRAETRRVPTRLSGGDPVVLRTSSCLFHCPAERAPDIGAESRGHARAVLAGTKPESPGQPYKMTATQHLGKHLRLIVGKTREQFVTALPIQHHHDSVLARQSIGVILRNHVVSQKRSSLGADHRIDRTPGLLSGQ